MIELNGFFLQHVLSSMGFLDNWISLTMNYVTSISFSVLINGSPCKVFKPSRSLIQGDPLSLYLFILCA